MIYMYSKEHGYFPVPESDKNTISHMESLGWVKTKGQPTKKKRGRPSVNKPSDYN